MTRYTVHHRTHYAYEAPVVPSYGQHHLLPRDTPTQRCVEARVAILPAPAATDVGERRDIWGNRVGHFALHEPHDELEVAASSVVDVVVPVRSRLDMAPTVRDATTATRSSNDAEVRDAVLPSRRVRPSPRLHAYAQDLLAADRPVLDALAALTSRIHHDFDFDPAATTVSTPLDDVLDARAGVCQDFAHLLIGCLRAHGLAARYVSGYLETEPPPGAQRLQGADASHAWAALHVPGLGWVDADPTNDVLPGDRHVTVAWGRDYDDVAPLAGVIFTEGSTDELTVEVDVLRMDEHPVDDPGAAVGDGRGRSTPTEG